jgi:hypothetical protein
MFGLFKNQNLDKFNSLTEFRSYCQKELEKDAIAFYKKSPLRGGPLEGTAILLGLNHCFEKLKNRIPHISSVNNWKEQIIEDEIRNAFRHVYDTLIES